MLVIFELAYAAINYKQAIKFGGGNKGNYEGDINGDKDIQTLSLGCTFHLLITYNI